MLERNSWRRDDWRRGRSGSDTMAAVDAAALTQAKAAVAVFANQLGHSSADFGRASFTTTDESARALTAGAGQALTAKRAGTSCRPGRRI
jgi:hypothetical protein